MDLNPCYTLVLYENNGLEPKTKLLTNASSCEKWGIIASQIGQFWFITRTILKKQSNSPEQSTILPE